MLESAVVNPAADAELYHFWFTQLTLAGYKRSLCVLKVMQGIWLHNIYQMYDCFFS